MLLKYIICASQIQIARHLSNQPELRFRYNLDVFNHTRGGCCSVEQGIKNYATKNVGVRNDITVTLGHISPNTTQVNQTNELNRTMNNELKFDSNIEIDKHLVPMH